jgi:hypothetical protein
MIFYKVVFTRINITIPKMKKIKNTNKDWLANSIKLAIMRWHLGLIN